MSRKGTGAINTKKERTRDAVRHDTSDVERRRRARRAEKRSMPSVRRPRTPRTEGTQPARRGMSPRAAEWIYKVLLAAAVLCALCFAASTYFRVGTIEVRGNEKCTADAVAEASGVKIGDRLLFVDRKAAAEGIFEKLPYAEAVRVRRSFPSTLVIELRECTPAAAVISDNVAYLITEECKLLEYMPRSLARGMLTVKGLAVTKPVPGELLGCEDELRLQTLQEMLDALSEAGILDQVDELHVEKLADVNFLYKGVLTVKVGDTNDLKRKLELLQEVVGRLPSGDKGTLDVSEGTTARFLSDTLA